MDYTKTFTRDQFKTISSFIDTILENIENSAKDQHDMFTVEYSNGEINAALNHLNSESELLKASGEIRDEWVNFIKMINVDSEAFIKYKLPWQK